MSAMSWINRLVKRSVVVHTSTGASIRGVLVGVYRDSLVLAHAIYLDQGGNVDVDGEAVVPRSNVSWIQTLPAGDPV